jgi:hypothetical protein
MSYARDYSKTIRGTVSGTVSYPASQNGGSKSVTFAWAEDINVRIVVDTEPFDASVDKCENHVDLLTGAVVATQGVAVAAKSHASKVIGKTVVDGFFGHIRSEIDQQMTMLHARLEPLAMQLGAQAGRCRHLSSQMAQDFARISSRYIKLFGDLDLEMKRRIQSIDQASFELAGEATERIASERSANGALVPSITAQESEHTKNSILVSALKKRALDMIRSVRTRMITDRELSDGLSRVLGEDLAPNAARRDIYVPAIRALVDDVAGGGKRTSTYCAGGDFKGLAKLPGAIEAAGGDWQAVPPEAWAEIERHWMRRLGAWSAGNAGAADTRVAKLMQKLWENRSRP